VFILIVLQMLRATLSIPQDDFFLEIIEQDFWELLSHKFVAGVLRVGSFFESNHKNDG